MNIVSQVSSIPLFEGLPQGQIDDLAMIAVSQVFPGGRIIFSEGDSGNGFYAVISGRVKIFKMSWEGKEQILHIFGPGEIFGEVPVFIGERFPASAEAIEESRIFFFPRDALIGLIRENPDLALNMMAILSRRLRRFTRLVEDLSLKEVPGRLSAYLLFLSQASKGSHNLELDISKGQLASLLGTIPETLSRILGKMKKRGLVTSQGHKIEILDVQGLKDLADGSDRL